MDGIEPSSFIRSRKRSSSSSESHGVSREREAQATNWRRILLLIVAITVHNIPGIHVLQFLSSPNTVDGKLLV